MPRKKNCMQPDSCVAERIRLRISENYKISKMLKFEWRHGLVLSLLSKKKTLVTVVKNKAKADIKVSVPDQFDFFAWYLYFVLYVLSANKGSTARTTAKEVFKRSGKRNTKTLWWAWHGKCFAKQQCRILKRKCKSIVKRKKYKILI